MRSTDVVAPVLAVLLFACGGGAPPANHPPSNDSEVSAHCDRFLRHLVEIGALVHDDKEDNAGDFAGEPEAFIASRCHDPEYLAAFEQRPATVIECLEAAQSAAAADACYVTEASAPHEPAPAKCAAASIDANGTATIEGVVRSPGGELLEGVTVIVEMAGTGSLASVTNDVGHYRLSDVPPGQHTVAFYYGDQQVTKRCVAASGQQTTTIDAAIDSASAP